MVITCTGCFAVLINGHAVEQVTSLGHVESHHGEGMSRCDSRSQLVQTTPHGGRQQRVIFPLTHHAPEAERRFFLVEHTQRRGRRLPHPPVAVPEQVRQAVEDGLSRRRRPSSPTASAAARRTCSSVSRSRPARRSRMASVAAAAPRRPNARHHPRTRQSP